jgi:hypothetical protein
VSGLVGAYVAQIDAVLAAGQSLFVTPVTAPGLNTTEPATTAPVRGSGLSFGVDTARRDYQTATHATTELDLDTDRERGAATTDHERSTAAATNTRTIARTQADAIAPSTRSPAGARLLVSTMDERLEAMQRAIRTAKAQQLLLATRLRQLAAAYRMTQPHTAKLLSASHFQSARRPSGAGLVIPRDRVPQAHRDLPAAPDSAPHLTRNSSPHEVAARILWEAQRRGYSREQSIAILSTAMRESALNPRAVSPNGRWENIFQQDASYPNRHDPNAAIADFFDRLGMKGGRQSPDIWKAIFWLQQRPGEPSAEAAFAHGRQEYLAEIQSELPAATRLCNQLLR